MIKRDIDIQKVLDKHGLEKNTLATLLFPGHARPLDALTRLMKGDTELTVKQMFVICDYCGISTTDFLENTWTYEEIYNSKNTGFLLFTKGDFTAVLDNRFMTSKLYKKDVFLKDMLFHKRSIRVASYINDLESWIKEYV